MLGERAASVKRRPAFAPPIGSRHNERCQPRKALHRFASADGCGCENDNDIDNMKLFARDALLPAGWARDVVIEVGMDGNIRAVEPAFTPPSEAERVQGALVPGMPNVHSHAFQRALAGLTERGGPKADDFWTWRA